jgi:hypothetical protein
VQTTHVNAIAERVSIGFIGSASVKVRATALDGTRLRAARITSIRREPCATGQTFVLDWAAGAWFGIERDGVTQTEGPVDISGSHELDFAFANPRDPSGALRSPLRGSSAIDLQVDSPQGQECVRVPLGADAPERTWSPDPDEVGFLWSIGGRAFPDSGLFRPGVAPIASLVERLGVMTQGGAYFGEISVGGGPQFAFIGFGVGGNRVLWSEETVAFTAGLAYEVAMSIGQTPEAGLQYVMHGPRVTPAFSWFPFSRVTSYPGFPPGRRTPFFELEFPLGIWFGTGGAPAIAFVPGVGLSFHLAL